MADIKKEETKVKSQTKVGILSGAESERLQAEGWIVTAMYKDPENPLRKLHDLERRSKD